MRTRLALAALGLSALAAAPALALQIESPGTACTQPDYGEFWEQSSLCPSSTNVWQRPAFQFGASTSQTCAAGLAGMVQWTGTAASPNNKLEFCNGTSWYAIATPDTGILFGATATAANPSRTGDAGTGFFSDTAATVEVALAGVEALRVTATGSVGIGTATPAHKLEVNGSVNLSSIAKGYYIAGNKVLFQPASDTTSLAVGPSALAAQALANLGNTAVGGGVLFATTTGP